MTNTFRTFLVAVIVGLLQGTGILQVQADNNSWMSNIPDNTYMSQLSIPGSHDAGTGHGVNNVYGVVSGSTYAVTQGKNLTEQWNSGIRAFDLRPAVDGSNLRIYHGIVSTNLYLNNALSTLCGLLDSHPTETCIVIIRHESEADDNNSSWASKMKDLLNSNPTKSHAVNFNPMAKLGDMRGKLLILSRDNYDTNPVGGYITGWGFSSDFNNQKGGRISGVGTQGPLYIQDFYDVSASGAPATKTASVQRMLQFTTSENTDPSQWVINQTSGYSKTKSILSYTLATSDGYRDNAATQNAKAIEYINNHPGPTGIILMDYAAEDASNGYNVKGQALTNAIIASNSKAGPNTDYFRALGAITTGNDYIVTTTINGMKYYLTTNGTLTDEEVEAGVFRLQNGQSGDHNRSFYFTWTDNSTTYTFTNSSLNTGANGTFSSENAIVTRKKDRENAYDCQVLFRNSSGKYAIRATNAAYSENGSWAQHAANTYWSIKNSSSTPPTVGYKKGEADYIWNIETAPTTVKVTYNLYYNAKKYAEIVTQGERNAAAALPAEYIKDFCNYTYSPKNITSSSIKVTVRWASSAPFKISSASMNWYNIKVGRLARYVGWENREPYHPHAYDEASVGEYPEMELYATDLVRASDAYQWAFVGNPIEGFKIINRLKGEDYSLTADGTSTSARGVLNIKNTVLREGDFRWTPHADGDGFSLSLNGQNDYYINTHGGPDGYLQIWENANARTDLGSQIIAEAAPTASVPMTPIGTGYYTTLCLPYDVIVSGAKVYILEKGEDDDEEGNIVLPIINGNIDGGKALAPALHDVEAGYVLLTLFNDTVPAGTPVVLCGENETALLTYGEGFALQPSTTTALRGLYIPASLTNVLTLQGQDDIPYFYAFTDEAIEPNKVYLKLKNKDIQELTLRFNDVEDGIQKVLPIEKESVDIFNLSGQRMSRLQKGINIINKKKIITR